MWTRLRNKLRYLLGGRRIDRDLAQELAFHTEMLAEDRERLGTATRPPCCTRGAGWEHDR